MDIKRAWIMWHALFLPFLLLADNLELIAHRGGMPTMPENTLGAFEKVLRYTSSIETDIHFTRDNVPMILHDNTLDRTTNCQGYLSHMRWQEARQCRLHKRSGHLSRLRLPTLWDLLHDRRLSQANLTLEIKENNRKGIDRLMRMIHGRKSIRIASFNRTILHDIHRRYHFKKLYLVSMHAPRHIPKYLRGIFLCSAQANRLTLSRIPKSFRIFLWTVNTAREFARIRHLRINGIITDRVRYFRNKIK